MLSHAIRSILSMIPTLLGITLVTFLIISLAPGDPVATSFGAGAGEPGAEAGAGQSRERLADAIKAKKKLLGMVREDHAVRVWSGPDAPVAAVDDRTGAAAMSALGAFRELPGWAYALAPRANDQLVVGGEAGYVLIADLVTGAVQRELAGGLQRIASVATASTGDLIAAADIDGRIALWRGEAVKPAAVLEPLGKPVRSLAFLPDGSRLLSACDDGLIRLHQADTGAVMKTYSGHIAGVYSLAVSADGTGFYSAGYDRVLRHWRWVGVGGEAAPRPRFVHGQAVNALALSPDGSLLATGSDDRVLRVFAVPDLAGDAAEVAPAAELAGHYREITAVAFGAESRTLFSGSRDETVRSWDLRARRQVGQTTVATGVVHALIGDPADPAAVRSAASGWVSVPIISRYLKWLRRVVTFDFDRSFVDDRKVMEKIGAALPVTLGLNAIALVLIYAVSIPLGITAAVRRGTAYDHVSSVVLFVLYSIPNFWLATLLIMGLSSKQTLDILPSVGLHDIGEQDLSFLPWLADFGLHLVLPIACMVYAGFASLSRYARTTMLETIGQDYIRTARAKGLPESLVLYKHALRNSLITIVTLAANLLPAMIGGSVIVEYIFSINGMGKLGFDAILARDYPVIMAITTFSAFLTLLGILLSDFLYTVVDPRITHK
ncbi:MAG: ABC transporter permease subunit [Candidatus Schekmanbacteria bacterium]|nr:ABC transporter permease subunit [Candidatus Schekmanbacteria bacterium]